MTANPTLIAKYASLNKSCIGWKDIQVLLDINQFRAKKIFTELKNQHKGNPYIRKTEIPMSLVEKELINLGMNPAKIIKAYQIEKDNLKPTK